MSYFIELPKDSYLGRKQIDLPRFAADLAKELGVTREADGEHPDSHQNIKTGADMLTLYADNHQKKVVVSINAPDVAYGDWSTYDKAQRVESASVNPDGRSIAAIARDIKKRVIDANQSALAARRAWAAQQRQNRADIVRHADALKAAQPTLSIRVNVEQQTATIYQSSPYIDARLDANGKVTIQRIDGVSSETFNKIMAALTKSS